jgi:hypothetical protein
MNRVHFSNGSSWRTALVASLSAGLAGAALAPGCARTGQDTSGFGGGGSSSAGVGGGNGSAGSGGLGNSGSGLGGGADAATCASEVHKGQVIPLDMFIMVDQSGSMTDEVTGPNGTTAQKWTLLVQAFTSFLDDPGSAGLGAGIGYFPIPAIDDSSCDAATYAAPDVPIAALPGNASAIIASLNGHKPGGQTPTVPALSGALDYAKSWATSHPTHKVVVAYATDGDPHGCSNDTVAVAAGVAQEAAVGTPPIQTYVIGIGGNLTSLGQIAEGGSTGQAIIVNTSQDTAQQLLAAMNEIRAASAVPCVLTIPVGDAGPVDFTKVNIVESPSDGGAPFTVLQVPGLSTCDPGTGGWYYDDPSAPTRIELCSATCDAITVDLTSQVDVQLGCKTLTAPPR